MPTVLLRAKQWDKAATAARIAAPTGSAEDPCWSLATEFTAYSLRRATEELRAIADTAAYNYGALLHSPLARCADGLAIGIIYDSVQANRPRAADAVMRVADSVHRAGNAGEAYRAARAVARVDTSRRAALRATPWIDSLGRQFEVGAAFDGGSMVVYQDSAVLEFHQARRDPVLIDPPFLALSRIFRFSVPASAATDSTALGIALAHYGPRADTARYGTLEAFAATMNDNIAEMFERRPGGRYLRDTTLRAQATPDGIRVAVKGPIVAELRRLRPAQGSLQAVCTLTTAGLCTPKQVSIEYR